MAPSKFPISDAQASVEQRSFVHGSLQKESAVTIDQLAHQLIGWLRKKDSSSAFAAGVKLERNDLHEVSVDRFLADVPTEDLFGGDRQKIEQRRREALSLLRDALPRDLKSPASTNPCWLIANPHGGPRRVFLTLPSTFATDPDRRIYAAEMLDGASDLVVDVPPMGIVRLEPTTETKKGPSEKVEPSLSETTF